MKTATIPAPTTGPEIDIDAAIAAITARGMDPGRVSYPCTIGQHRGCTGRIIPDGAIQYVKCECDSCAHPELTDKRKQVAE
jgi:hypothetical protein